MEASKSVISIEIRWKLLKWKSFDLEAQDGTDTDFTHSVTHWWMINSDIWKLIWFKNKALTESFKKVMQKFKTKCFVLFFW